MTNSTPQTTSRITSPRRVPRPSPRICCGRTSSAAFSVGPVTIPKVYNGKDRTFFMFDYEGRTLRQPNQIATANVPTAAFENGDLSALMRRVGPTGRMLCLRFRSSIPLPGAVSRSLSLSLSRSLSLSLSRIPISRAFTGHEEYSGVLYPTAQFATGDPITGTKFLHTHTHTHTHAHIHTHTRAHAHTRWYETPKLTMTSASSVSIT